MPGNHVEAATKADNFFSSWLFDPEDSDSDSFFSTCLLTSGRFVIAFGTGLNFPSHPSIQAQEPIFYVKMQINGLSLTL
ncbi:MAG: hypothetical protein AAF649_10675 [Verrucomicrobiota bacterium]